MSFKAQYNDLKNAFEKSLEKIINPEIPSRLREGMAYSLLGGGKRLRPLLYLCVLNAYGKAVEVTDISVACAIECLHVYSLVHDDLPCMDNDDYRRGKPTNHKKFGETTAVLVGDALQCLAFELLSEVAIMEAKYAKIARCISSCAGARGMVGGQSTEFETTDFNEENLRLINGLKTGKLIEASLVSGCISAGQENEIGLWKEVSSYFGQAFQLCDDLLDEKTDENTLVALYGREKSEKLLANLVNKTLNVLDKTTADTSFLKELSKEFLLRTTDGL